jgi:hypothetical protein
MYETYKEVELLDNGILCATSSAIAKYDKWVSLRHVATIVEYKGGEGLPRLSLNMANGDAVHIENEQDFLDRVIDAWGLLQAR